MDGHWRNHGETGVTLIESVVSIAILAIAFSVFVGGMFTSILGSDHHRKQATAEAVLRQFAEALKVVGYVDCATPVTPAYASSFTAPAGYTSTIPSIAYWGGSSFVIGCPSPDEGLQRISLAVASSDGRAREVIDIVKRKP